MNFLDSLRRQKFLSFTVVLLTLCAGVLIGTVLNTGVKAAHDSAAPGAMPLTVGPATTTQNSFATIAKALEPSVVNISSEYYPKQTARARNNNRQMMPQSPDQGDQGGMEDFFRRFFNSPMNPGGPDQEPHGASLGSGFVVDRNGYIITNNHVVEKASRIRVQFNGDQTQYPARVIGTDPETDLAVIKVDRANLTPVRIGNSDAVQVGDWSIAIGSPFGFQETVTAGIISAKSRDLPGEGVNAASFQHFLQTDAAINPGNSGGPLLDINGQVIGINTQIASRSGGYQGIGFAMPVNTAVKVYNQIIKNGKVIRGSIGISFRQSPDTPALLKAYGAKNGVFVERVEPNGPADKAGIKAEDIITSINGSKILTGNDLIDMVADTPVGNAIHVDYVRDGKTLSTSITVADRYKIFPQLSGNPPANPDQGDDEEAAPTQARFGISIQNLNPRMRDNLGLQNQSGILVANVEPGSFAEDIGLAQNDVIVDVNRTPINSLDDFKRVQSTLKTGQAVAIVIMRSQGDGQQAKWTKVYLAGTVPPSGSEQ